MIADLKTGAEVVGSNPTPSTFIVLVKHGIRISTFFDLGHLRLMMELFYPLLLSWNVSKMGMLNNRNRKMSLLRSIHLVATIFTLTIIFASTTTLVSASTTGNTTITTTTSAGGEQEAVSSTTTTNDNVSNAVLGDVFMIVEFETASVNPINETYIEISTVHNVTLMPPNATTGMTINATETANTTVNILPNGLALDKGQSLIVAEGDDDDGTAEQENATTTFVDLSRMNPDGTGSGTGVVFFSTNSTGQLAFLDNRVGINDSEFSQGGGTIRVWEWKGGTLPLETDSPPTTGNQTIITSAPEEEE
jgi:hypothetical protein